MRKKILIETKFITSSQDVIDNTLEFLSVDVDECAMVESRILKLLKCPSCNEEIIQKGYNYCPICSQKIKWD